MVDMRALGKPSEFAGDEASWKSWSFVMLSFSAEVSSCVCGAESASRPDPLQLTGALVELRQLRASDVEDADVGEVGAAGEDRALGKRPSGGR